MILSKFDLTDNVAIVTGAGTGIGKSVALGLAQAGAHVVVVEVNPTTGKATAAEIQTVGRKALTLATDVRDSEQVADMVQQTLREFDRVDFLVNNVGGLMVGDVPKAGPTLEMNEDIWDAVIILNLKTTWLCCKAVAPEMIRQGKGSIINISSIAGLVPYPNAAHYATAKAGVNNLTKTLALEWASYNIRVNAIAPGSIDTPLSRQFYKSRPELREDRLKRIPLGHRFGQPEDIAAAAVYLASDASSYITGETLVVAGGLTSLAG